MHLQPDLMKYSKAIFSFFKLADVFLKSGVRSLSCEPMHKNSIPL